MGLLPLDEVRRRLRITGQSYAGVREVPFDRIVGSADRSEDFGGVRPALARQRQFVDAGVTVLHTNYALPPDVDVGRLIHTEQQRLLTDESGLDVARPDAVIEFARPRGYPELLEVIKAHGFDLARRLGALPPAEDVAADWYDRVYLPGLEAVRRAGLVEAHPYKTEADLFLWAYERRRDLRVLDAAADWSDAAAYMAREGVGRPDRRVIESEAAAPLSPRPEGST